MGRKNKGAGPSVGAPESVEPAESAPVAFVLVTNKRGGAIHVGPATFPPGASSHESSVFAAFSPAVVEALADMVAEGWLEFGPHDSADAPAPAAPPAPPAVVEVSPFPTLEAIKASTSAAELDGWFQTPGLPVELSEAILVQHSALSPA